MRIKIISNNIKFNSSFTSIDKYIGQIFKVESLEENGNVDVNIKDVGLVTILPDEYEIVESKDIVRELDNFIGTYYPYELEKDDVKSFILANRVKLFEILR